MKTIAWDVDDTLNNFMRIWLTHWRTYADKSKIVDYSQLIENPPGRILGIEHAKYLESIDSFRLSKEYELVTPLDPVLSWFKTHGHKARHIVVTAVPIFAAPASAAWVMQHFGTWIRSYNVIPSWRTDFQIPVYFQNKTEFLSWFGNVDILVEDNVDNLISAQSAGFDVVGIPQPWNKIEDDLESALEKIKIYIEG